RTGFAALVRVGFADVAVLAELPLFASAPGTKVAAAAPKPDATIRSRRDRPRRGVSSLIFHPFLAVDQANLDDADEVPPVAASFANRGERAILPNRKSLRYKGVRPGVKRAASMTQKRFRSSVRRDMILDAATALIMERGLAGFSMTELARAAG